MLPSVDSRSTVAVHSTIHPATCEQLAVRLAERGATLVDAPVSGGPAPQKAGSLVVMVGGGPMTSSSGCRPVFGTYGDPVLHVGPRGSALLAKLVNNALMMAQVTLADDARGDRGRRRVDRSALVAIISNGSGNSFSFGVRAGFDSMDSFATVAADHSCARTSTSSPTCSPGRRLDPGDLVAVADHGLAEPPLSSPTPNLSPQRGRERARGRGQVRGGGATQEGVAASSGSGSSRSMRSGASSSSSRISSFRFGARRTT